MDDNNLNNEDKNKNNNNIYEFSKEEMKLKTKVTESLGKRLIGPIYIIGGIYGFYKGIIKGNKVIPFKILTKKIIFSCYLNYICEQSLKYSNTFGSLASLYCLLNYTYDFLEKKIKRKRLSYNIENNFLKNSLIGFSTGSLYKCTNGLSSSILNGLVIGNCSLMISYIYNNRDTINKKKNDLLKTIKLYKH